MDVERGMQQMQRKRIAVITARADDSEQRMILGGIAETAFSMNADVAVYSNIYNLQGADELLNFENHIYDFFQPEYFDGVIITAEAFRDMKILDDVMHRIRKSGIPSVIIDGKAKGFVRIVSDDEADMQRVAEHLITVHGLTRIDILTGFADSPVSHARVSGCRKAFAEHGIAFDESHVYYGNFWTDAGEKLAERYLSGNLPMPQAVICTNDFMAFGLCDALTAAGVRIPEEIMVTGYDHTDSRIYHHPILTTYRRNRWRMGAEAAAHLLSSDRIPYPEENRLICGNTCTCGADNVQLNDEIRAARIGQHHSVMSSVAQFTSRLTLCRTLAEYMAVLQEYFYLLHGAAGLYLALDQAWNRSDYEGDTFLCFTIRAHSQPDTPAAFAKDALFPAFLEERDKPMIFYFSPLCFQTRLFGYTVLAYEHPQCYDFSFRDWNKNVANSLEFLRMKNDIHYLRQCQRVSSLHDSLTGFYHLREFRRIAETAEEAGDCFLQAVKLHFPDGGEYVYGENYRSDIIAAAAKAVKQSAGMHEICCRASDDLFLILCRQENGRIFSDKLKVMLHHVLCHGSAVDQVIVTYAEYTGKSGADAVNTICHEAERIAEEMLAIHQEKQLLPHYKALFAIRSNLRRLPKDAPSTEEICRKLCISGGYFRVTYKKCFGVSYVQDCIHAKTMLACYLLCTTAMSIYAISKKCGYSDEKYFARQFRQSTGFSPMEYRERYC